ncbi:MAG: NAD(P)/FAD-dependent oxidoreductase [Thermoleophilaceae bacterium]
MTEGRQASVVEMAPMRTAKESYDVAILGGGLAGLTLSIQLKKERPETSLAVLEKREGPAPLAAFKVGESTVLSGAHYFAEVVGMRNHLDEKHLRKNGLRFFPPAGDNSDITKRVESGPPIFSPVATWQLDRGLYENELAARARAAGVELLQGARVAGVELGDELHTVNFTHFDEERATRARWVVDAAGRASLLKRQLGLSEGVEHTINSAWFRLAGGLDIEEWGASNPDWMGRMAEPGLRTFSTNHLLGEGYWVWMIPLSTGPISIGVCADPRYHPFEEIETLEGMVDWLHRHEPQLAAAVEPRLGQVEDFLRVKDFAYGVKRMLSPERWSLVGEAAAFADPYISPGSDMIAYSNTFSCDVITRSLDGEDVSDRIEYWDRLYHRTFEHVLSRTENVYPVFGNPWVMAVKFSWDAWISHCAQVLLFVKGKLTDIDFVRSVEEEVGRIYRLNIQMHELFRDWHELEPRDYENEFVKTALVTPIRENLAMPNEDYDDDGLRDKLRWQVRMSEAMSVAVFHKAAAALPEPPDPARAVNPYALGLKPDQWETSGLHDEPGMTLEQARQAAEGVDWLWLDYVPPEA